MLRDLCTLNWKVQSLSFSLGSKTKMASNDQSLMVENIDIVED